MHPFFPKTMNSDVHSPPSSSKDTKPTLDKLESMLHKAELLDRSNQPPSWQTLTTSHNNGVDPCIDAAALAQIIAATATLALCATKQALFTSVPLPPPHCDPTKTIIDMALCSSPCLSAEMDLGRIQVACTARGNTVKVTRKIFNR